MEHNKQIIQQVDRAIERTIIKFPNSDDTTVFTDIHMRAIQDSGELLSFDDDGKEVNRAVIDGWIDNTDENFYHEVAALLRQRLHLFSEKIEEMGIIKPFSFILEDDEAEQIAELYVADDDTIILGGDLMEGLDEDLDNFIKGLLKDE